MKRLLLIGLLSLGFLSNLEATVTPHIIYENPADLPDYSSYIAAIDSGNFNPYGAIRSDKAGMLFIPLDGLTAVIQNEGQNGPHAQKIRDARARANPPMTQEQRDAIAAEIPKLTVPQ